MVESVGLLIMELPARQGSVALNTIIAEILPLIVALAVSQILEAVGHHLHLLHLRLLFPHQLTFQTVVSVDPLIMVVFAHQACVVLNIITVGIQLLIVILDAKRHSDLVLQILLL
eukprot:NODE_389_length_8228_cov_1.280600.p6 type:complete len:115 gc:universal NODE_389_length_8228_cov_1.280600:299-643(+)